MAKKIIIVTMFNTLPFREERLSKDWIEKRIAIFTNYTLKSLKAQSNQDFLSLIAYDEKSSDLVQNTLAQYDPLPDNIKFITPREYGPEYREYLGDAEEFLLTRLDSDNLYHKSYIEDLHNYQPRGSTEILISQHGYIYNCLENRLAHWYHESPPFYSFIYHTADYQQGKRHKMPAGHRDAIKLKHEILPPGAFIVLIHDSNTMGNFDNSMRKDIIDDPSLVKEILCDFGIV